VYKESNQKFFIQLNWAALDISWLFNWHRKDLSASENSWDLCLAIKLQNYRITKVGKDLQGHIVQPCTCTPLNHVPYTTIKHFSNTFRDGDSTTSLGSPFQCLIILSKKKYLRENYSCLKPKEVRQYSSWSWWYHFKGTRPCWISGCIWTNNNLDSPTWWITKFCIAAKFWHKAG